MKSDLEVLQEARDVLEESYIPYFSNNGRGHCASGALQEVSSSIQYMYCMKLLDASARRLHPELAGKIMPRLQNASVDTHDSFDGCPTVYVNNQLGKEAILAVFDDAIADLELQSMLKETEEEINQETGDQTIQDDCPALP